MEPRTIGLWPGVVAVAISDKDQRCTLGVYCIDCAEKQLTPEEMAYVETGFGDDFPYLYAILSDNEQDTRDYDNNMRPRTCDDCGAPLADEWPEEPQDDDDDGDIEWITIGFPFTIGDINDD